MKRVVFLCGLIFVSAYLIKADIALEPNQLKMRSDLIIQTEDDLSDFRFFLDFIGAVHEIEVKSKTQTIIPSMGGGARYNNGILLAIPRSKLKNFPDQMPNAYDETGKTFSNAVREKKIEGIVELGKHQFSSIINVSERNNWSYPTYKIERTTDSLKLTKAYDLSPKISEEEENKIKSGAIDFNLYKIYKGLTPLGYFILIGLPAITIIFLGIWFFRKKG